jgi:hypothetical protein
VTLSVYVAASSAEVDRAVRWIAMLRGDGIHVTSSWPEVIAKHGGVANPRDATNYERRRWASQDLNEVQAADVLWLLAPSRAPSFGAGWECGAADALGNVIVASGDTKASIFLGRANEFATDDEGFEFVQHLARLHARGGREAFRG